MLGCKQAVAPDFPMNVPWQRQFEGLKRSAKRHLELRINSKPLLTYVATV